MTMTDTTTDTQPDELNECPKCKAKSATSEVKPDGSGRFYCTQPKCDFEVPLEKQNLDKARGKLEDIKAKLFGKH